MLDSKLFLTSLGLIAFLLTGAACQNPGTAASVQAAPVAVAPSAALPASKGVFAKKAKKAKKAKPVRVVKCSMVKGVSTRYTIIRRPTLRKKFDRTILSSRMVGMAKPKVLRCK